MPAMRFIVLGLLISLSACEGKSSPSPKSSEPESSEPGLLSSPAKTGIPPQAPSGLHVLLERAGAAAQLRIQNRGDVDVSLAAALTLEPIVEGSGQAPGTQPLSIRADCGSLPPVCVTLAPGAELVPALLRLHAGDMQCGEATAPLSAGRYRVRLHGCGDAPYEKVSAALSLP